MRITIIAVGRLKERFWAEAVDEYLKRLRSYADVRVVEVADRDPSRGGEARAVGDEGVDVLKAIRPDDHVIALDVRGRSLDSVAFSEEISRHGVEGRSSLAFVIGGSHGLAPSVLERADSRLSLGPLTLPHNLARVVLVEQLYRAFRIARGEPYHK
ncbi:MAG: 23S rRNA (pseudouridine(1915)-N(3))-methyltransferase RlmH [Coriobacteriia bacterium]|nr:23S rRNA (pseudouridine(1915)-N(3))-methyltransferase RlmH [Coriobacteriia bacterium]